MLGEDVPGTGAGDQRLRGRRESGDARRMMSTATPTAGSRLPQPPSVDTTVYRTGARTVEKNWRSDPGWN